MIWFISGDCEDSQGLDQASHLASPDAGACPGLCCSYVAALMLVTPLSLYKGPLSPQTSFLLKDETRQTSGSYKYRSAFTRLQKVKPISCFVAASTGNHGLALATAAQVFGHKAKIFVPEKIPTEKLQLIRAQSALVVLIKGDLKACSEAAVEDASTTGSIFVSSFDDQESIDGHGSMLREIETQADRFDEVFVPLGGGGMLATALLHWSERTGCVVGVEQMSVRAMSRSLEQAERITALTAESIAEGINVPQVGKIAFELCSKHRPLIVAVSENEIIEAMRLLWRWNGIRAEGAGAAAFAGALKCNSRNRDRVDAICVCVVSGGNISEARFSSICNVNTLPYGS